MKNLRRLDKAITRTLQGLVGHAPLDADESLFTVAEIAGNERKLRKSAMAVVEASKGTDEAAIEEAIDQLRKALK